MSNWWILRKQLTDVQKQQAFWLWRDKCVYLKLSQSFNPLTREVIRFLLCFVFCHQFSKLKAEVLATQSTECFEVLSKALEYGALAAQNVVISHFILYPIAILLLYEKPIWKKNAEN